jgi:hypothetical protein
LVDNSLPFGICNHVYQELLQGAYSKNEFETLKNYFLPGAVICLCGDWYLYNLRRTVLSERGRFQMYKEVEGNQRMSSNEAAERYPDSYIIMRMDSMDISNQMGTVLYVGDKQREIFSVLVNLKDSNLCGVSEGMNLRRSLGGVVVGG